jgi:integrase
VKSFLCAVLSHAIREGHIQPPNPLHGRGVIVIEGGLPSEDTYAYDLGEIAEMLDTLTNKTHQTAVTVAGFSGLSLAELRGLRWENIGKDVLTVQRTYWHREEGETKTAARKAEVPLIPQVSEILKAHRKRNPNTQFVFEGPYFRPLDLATMGSKGIKKALQGSKVDWHGWHALRRGLGTNLHDLGVQDKTIQAILRHSNVFVTQSYYIKTRQKAGVDAMKKLSAALLKLGKAA